MLKKIIVGLMLGFFILSNCIMFCASSAISPDEITPTRPIIETQVPITEVTTAPIVEATLAPTTEPTRPPIIFVNHSYTEGLSKVEIEEQITTLYDYISYLESACQTYDEVAEEISNVKEIISQYESCLAEIIDKENHYNKCYTEYPEATTVWFYMKDKFGWSDVACAGIMGNIMAEIGGGTLDFSNWNNDGANGYGMFQWTSERRRLVKSIYGAAPSIEEQLEFMYDELHGTDGVKNQISYIRFSDGTYCTPEYILNCETPEQVAKRFADNFERCNPAYRNPRKGYARIAYNYFVY